MKRAVSVAMLSILLLSYVSCQPTPKEEIINNRRDGALAKAVDAQALETYTLETPERWKETFEVREQPVKIDADVIVPDTDTYPVVTIVEKGFTAADASVFFKTLFGDEVELRQQVLSYNELLKELMLAERGYYKGVNETTGEILFERDEETIAELETQLAETPLEETYEALDGTFPIDEERAIRDENGNIWYGLYSDGLVTVSNTRGGMVQLESWVLQGDAMPGEESHVLENIQITQEEAIEIANQWVEKISKGDFSLALCDRARMVEGGASYDIAGEGYYLTYVRDIGGAVPFYYDLYMEASGLKLEKGDDNYAPGWKQEHIEIFVTEKGMQCLSWGDQKEVVETANENVQLLSFEEIQDCVRNIISYSLNPAWFAGMDDALLITKMVLTTSIQRVADQGEEAYMAPTWAILMTTEHNEAQHIDTGVLLISAIDGSIVWRW